MDCEATDSRSSWDWAVLKGETWKQHGKQVANLHQFITGSFDTAPRNPAEKINSGYKAWEFLVLVFGLSPALLYNVLPAQYWRNFCKLVRAIRILYQRQIGLEQLHTAHKLLLEFAHEFELLYY